VANDSMLPDEHQEIHECIINTLHSWDICFDKKSCDFNEHSIKDDNRFSATMETPNGQGSFVQQIGTI
jgi:hypothetical protein